MIEPAQPYVLHIPPNLARRVRELIDRPGSPYSGFNEFAVVAIENQLQLIAGVGEASPASAVLPATTEPSPVEAWVRPVDGQVETVPPSLIREPLFMLTNRMGPFPLICRVLVNMTLTDGPPDADSFVSAAGQAARAVGLQLQQRDAAEGPGPRGRRAVGWPVGAEAWRSQERFTTSFLFRLTVSGASGPMATLGLCNERDGHVFPTKLGFHLAELPNPLLGEAPDDGLSPAQQELLRDALRHSGLEFIEICAFVAALRASDGRLAAIDKRLARVHSDWSTAQVSAHRAALTGRLSDVGVITITGRGQNAQAKLTAAGEELTTVEQEAETGAVK